MKIVKFDAYEGTVLVQQDSGQAVQIAVPFDETGKRWIAGEALMTFIKETLEPQDRPKVELAENAAEILAMVQEASPFPTTGLPPEQVARSERDMRISRVEWRVNRYRSQKDLGIATSDSEQTFKAVLEYIEDLRNVTKQSGFPNNINWPNEPK